MTATSDGFTVDHLKPTSGMVYDGIGKRLINDKGEGWRYFMKIIIWWLDLTIMQQFPITAEFCEFDSGPWEMY